MSRQAKEGNAPWTVGKIRWLGLAILLAGSALTFPVPLFGSLAALAGLCIILGARKLAARYGAENTDGPADAEKPAARFLRQWQAWDRSAHEARGQAARMQRALTQKIEIVKISRSGTAAVRGTRGELYQTGFRRCSCPDFRERGVPCKHMYALAAQYAGFDLVPYVIRSHTMAHPLRGFLTMGAYKVKGTNPETNRQNTKTVYAVDEAGAIRAAAAQGLTGPFSAEETALSDAVGMEKARLDAGGIYIPAGAKSPDVAASIQRSQDGDETTVTEAQWQYAAECGIQLSALAGETAAKEIFHRYHRRWKE